MRSVRSSLKWIGIVVALGACAQTWHAPPGSEKKTIIGAALSAESRIMADIMKYGFPDTGMLRYREGYVLSYDARNRVPRWVAERLDAKRLARNVSREGIQYRPDQSIHAAFRSTSADFEGTEYVRGRLAAAANHLDRPVALKQTFYLSNVAPQQGIYFRQTFWVHLEKMVRDWARTCDDLHVVTGPLFLPQSDDEGKQWVRYELIGENRVAVPTHFFKVLLRERGGQRDMLAFLVPHRALEPGTDATQFLTTVDRIEYLAGLDFFPKLSEPTQSRLEATKADALWQGPATTAVPAAKADAEGEEEPAEAAEEEPEEGEDA